MVRSFTIQSILYSYALVLDIGHGYAPFYIMDVYILPRDGSGTTIIKQRLIKSRLLVYNP